MNKSDGDIPIYETRLATTDENGNRVYIHPEDIKGKWKSRRNILYWFLIFIYLFLPWIYVDNHQWILLDLPQREFHIFGNVFYGHDGPLLLFVILGFVILMAFITSIWGRVWCGWACPQTVFIDAIFRKIEKIVEGNSRKRKSLEQAPWSLNKILKRTVKWILYILVSLHIVHSFLGYFVGTHELINITLSSPEKNWTLFVTMLTMTGIILFDFGWFKEQFCIIACPYGRFQSVVMDDASMIVAYDKKRGEPRRNKYISKEAEGDCINCNHCVKACPTGIDIRQGTQMECIACTMCIDACDTIMTKVDKPTGLIRYTSENGLQGIKNKKITLRSLIYLGVLLLIFIGFIFSINHRTHTKVQFLRANHETAYQEIKNHHGEIEIVNHFRMKIYKAGGSSDKFELRVEDQFKKMIQLTTPFEEVEIENDSFEAPVFLKFSKNILINGSRKIKIQLFNKNTNKITTTKELSLAGPTR